MTHCWGDSCYFYFAALDFEPAKQKCANISAVLFSPNSQEEQLEVERYFWTTKYMANYWLGIERQNNRWGVQWRLALGMQSRQLGAFPLAM